MSLVALTMNDESENSANPFLVSDILTSTTQKNNASLPTIFDGIDESLGEESKRYPFGLIQKIYIIHDYIAIGLAGNVKTMSELLKEVKNYFELKIQYSGDGYKPSAEDIDNLIQSRLEVPKYHGCLYGFFFMSDAHDSGGAFNYHLSEGWSSKLTKRFGEVKACASGSKSFFELSDRFENYYVKGENEKGESSRFMNLIAKHITFFSQLVWTEMLSIETIKDFWGGNFEMIYYADGKLQKHQGISSLTIEMLCDAVTQEFSFIPIRYFENEYIDDLLIIHAIDFKNDQIRRFCVEPIYRDISDEERYMKGWRNNFYSNKLFLNCYFSFPDGKEYVVHYGGTKQFWDAEGIITKLEFEMKEGVPRIAIGKFHMDNIIKKALVGVGLIKE